MRPLRKSELCLKTSEETPQTTARLEYVVLFGFASVDAGILRRSCTAAYQAVKQFVSAARPISRRYPQPDRTSQESIWVAQIHPSSAASVLTRRLTRQNGMHEV